MNAVEAVSLELRYGDKVALTASDFVIPQGRVTALIGPNGSGKSTVLSAIAGTLAPTVGSIRVFGSEPIHARSRVAFVLQTTTVNETAPLTVREVVTMGRYSRRGLLGRLDGEDRRAVDAAIARMDLAGVKHAHLRELSGGQRHRVFVAQGLAQDHDLLLLDEPLTGLDLISAETIDAVIHEEQAAGRTVVLTTHDLAEARAADHVLLMAGRVVAGGMPASVLTSPLLHAAYGPALLHVEEARAFLDDPAHIAAQPRHVHRDRD